MTPPVIARWISIIENGRTDELDALIADGRAVFFSPRCSPRRKAVEDPDVPQSSRESVRHTDFHYIEHWFSEQSAILEFAATIDGTYVNGIDMIHWNDQEQIVSFKVMLRPLKALQTIIPAMAELLQQ